MHAGNRLFSASVGRALLSALFLAQAVMIGSACAYPMHDCPGGQCPGAPCDGICASVCRADYAKADQISGPDAAGVPDIQHIAVVPGLAIADIPDRSRLPERARTAPAAHPPAHIVFARMLN